MSSLVARGIHAARVLDSMRRVRRRLRAARSHALRVRRSRARHPQTLAREVIGIERGSRSPVESIHSHQATAEAAEFAEPQINPKDSLRAPRAPRLLRGPSAREMPAAAWPPQHRHHRRRRQRRLRARRTGIWRHVVGAAAPRATHIARSRSMISAHGHHVPRQSMEEVAAGGASSDGAPQSSYGALEKRVSPVNAETTRR